MTLVLAALSINTSLAALLLLISICSAFQIALAIHYSVEEKSQFFSALLWASVFISYGILL